MMVVLLDASHGDAPTLDEPALSKLRQLGVTTIELLRDESTLGIVLEGWAFEPSRVGDAAVAAMAWERGTRSLQPLLHMAVTASSEGGLQ
jgi:hypothetical protein